MFALALELRNSPAAAALTDTAREYIAGIERSDRDLRVTRDALRRAVDRIESLVDFQQIQSAARATQLS